MSPADIVSKPAIMRNVVVLPQPDGPRKAMNSPFATSRLIKSHDGGRRAVVIGLADADKLQVA